MRESWSRPYPAAVLSPDQASALVRSLPGRPSVLRVTELSGGLANTNLRLDLDGHPPVVLRLFQRDPAQAAKERAIHALAAERGLPAPRLLGRGDDPVTGLPFTLLEWVDGQRLDETARGLEDPALVPLARSLGAALAAIHAVAFDRSGFLDASLAVAEPVDAGGAGLIGFLRHVLVDGSGGQRLGHDLAGRLVAFAEREAGLLDRWPGPPCLTHSDFGGTNILVRQGPDGWAVAAVLDWEFAFSGSPFFDLGNLLRPPLGSRPGFADAVAAGYRAAGGSLTVEWRRMAALADLFSWAEFLTRPSVSDAVVATARQRIAETMRLRD
ncbi:aminoglycoside phosphotransferase family protein [Mycobacterium sp. KBS0706]|uniref:phosphotransferase family protein n=1 Tax=Mycobacterium sp. KBS0706 TaxID=2578109 RepID=UPI00110FC7F1|nr:phosphotransferase [Mycobacterium sp. KBS0706]TSD88871.1 aminoglycoside phosphotransferase family protein [Mycobacterium sp. KBS0706]